MEIQGVAVLVVLVVDILERVAVDNLGNLDLGNLDLGNPVGVDNQMDNRMAFVAVDNQMDNLVAVDNLMVVLVELDDLAMYLRLLVAVDDLVAVVEVDSLVAVVELVFQLVAVVELVFQLVVLAVFVEELMQRIVVHFEENPLVAVEAEFPLEVDQELDKEQGSHQDNRKNAGRI